MSNHPLNGYGGLTAPGGMPDSEIYFTTSLPAVYTNLASCSIEPFEPAGLAFSVQKRTWNNDMDEKREQIRRREEEDRQKRLRDERDKSVQAITLGLFPIFYNH